MAKQKQKWIELLGRWNSHKVMVQQRRWLEADSQYQTEKEKLDELYQKMKDSFYQVTPGLWSEYAEAFRHGMELKIDQQRKRVSAYLSRVEQEKLALIELKSEEKIMKKAAERVKQAGQKKQEELELKNENEYATQYFIRNKNG